MERFLPNQCAICSSTRNLRTCTQCYMISYCGVNHQKEHWKSQHKIICKTISKMMKEKGVSHLLEKLRGSDRSTWYDERMEVAEEVKKQLDESLGRVITEMFQTPRVCFVCHETCQEKLKNCPNCPVASFCNEHPRSIVHDRICLIRNNLFTLVTSQVNLKTLKATMISVGQGTKILSSSDEPPTSMIEFFDQYTQPKKGAISMDMKFFLSEFFSISLTTFSALQTLEQLPTHELVLHVDVGRTYGALGLGNYWETLLHFLPNIKIVTIIYIDSNKSYEIELLLCKKCTAKKRRLFLECAAIPYDRYIKKSNYRKPNMIIYLNVNPPEENDFSEQTWNQMKERWQKETCPTVVTSLTDKGLDLARDFFLSSILDFQIIYDGYNEFAPLSYIRELVDGSLDQLSQFIMIFKQRKVQSHDSSSLVHKHKIDRSEPHFYATVCHVCRSANTNVTCDRCKMIFYCGNKHRNQHQIHHMEICKVISILQKEMDESNLFNKFMDADSERWLRARIDLMQKAQNIIGRTFREYEKQMFLFPKTCMICHNCDQNELINCECGVSLCEIHKDDRKHLEFCKDLSMAFELSKRRLSPDWGTPLKPPSHISSKLPFSMREFINSYFYNTITFSRETNIYQDMGTSFYLTGPLTLLYAIEKLNIKIDSHMVVHLIGVNNSHLMNIGCWRIVFFWLRKLKLLKVVLLGPNISEFLVTRVDTSDLPKRDLLAESHNLKYNEFIESNAFEKPDLIMALNMDIHDITLGVDECVWKDTILAVKKVGAHFITTAGTEERAQRNHQIFCKFLEKSVDSISCEENPFAALNPQRDFVTNGVRYSNKYITIYKGEWGILEEDENQELIDECSIIERFQLKCHTPEWQVASYELAEHQIFSHQINRIEDDESAEIFTSSDDHALHSDNNLLIRVKKTIKELDENVARLTKEASRIRAIRQKLDERLAEMHENIEF